MNPVNTITEVTAEEFNLDALDSILRDLRNTRRALLTFESNKEELEGKFQEAHDANRLALETCNLEEVTKQTQIMKRLKGRMAEGTEDREAKFNDAVQRLAYFVEYNSDTDQSADVEQIAEAA